MLVLGGWWAWGGHGNSEHSFPNSLPYTSLPFGCSWVVPFMKQNVFMSSVSHSGKLSNLRRGPWESLIYSWSALSTGGLGLQLVSEVAGEQPCGTEPFTCGIWYQLQVDSVRFELNWHQLGVRELVGEREKNPRTLGVRNVLWVEIDFNTYVTTNPK